MAQKIKITSEDIFRSLIEKESDLYDSVIVSLPIYKDDIFYPFTDKNISIKNESTLKEIALQINKLIKNDTTLFIYGSPVQLIKFYEFIPKSLSFRYWISIDLQNLLDDENTSHLKKNQLGILMFTKGKYPSLNTINNRMSYFACTACGKNIKDWGGKKHLMNINGIGISDVWRDFYKFKDVKKDPDNPKIKLNIIKDIKPSFVLNNNQIPLPILKRLIMLIGEEKKILLVQIEKEYLGPITKKISESNVASKSRYNIDSIQNKVLLGDCIKVMENLQNKYPEGIFDLVFADPPYNLAKHYKVYDDQISKKEYIDWCNKWLELCIKLTKPTGSLLVLNIPKWALEHANNLNKFAYFQNWIVWDALSTPKGKIMPAHYSLLHYSKKADNFTYNKQIPIESPEYCLRQSCKRFRKNMDNSIINLKEKDKYTKKTFISDIWWDIPRIKHKKHRDDHPCQLPYELMERIIKMFSNENDLVFDPFAGAGTTSIVALKNNRKYLTIEIDPKYKKITEEKLNEVKRYGEVVRKNEIKKRPSIYTKKFLESKAQELTKRLGRKPSYDEFIKVCKFQPKQVEFLYNNPRDLLKAARIELLNGVH
ncbi:MAG: site-specific DNA-methyltransferase [Patescibacteria group bacterium]